MKSQYPHDSESGSDGETSCKSAFKSFLAVLTSPHDTQIGSILNINQIVSVYGLEKRRLYELFSVLCALNVSSRAANQCYQWNGTESCIEVIKNLTSSTANKVKKVGIAKAFEVSESPSISALALSYVEILFYFKGIEVKFKEASALMASSPSRIKQIFRRLYPISLYLEHLGIIEATADKTVFVASNRFRNVCSRSHSCTSITYLMNRTEGDTEVDPGMQDEFYSIVAMKSDMNRFIANLNSRQVSLQQTMGSRVM